MTDQPAELSDRELDTPLRVIDFDDAPDKSEWRNRAKAYDSQYKGPAHWVHLINVLAATGNIALACRECGLNTRYVTRRRERYPEFAEEFMEALEYFKGGVLEKTAHGRAVDGWLEPVYYKGEVCGTVRKFSDQLLVKLLEGNLPEKYRSKSDNTPGGNAITITGGLPTKEELAQQDLDAAGTLPE